MSTTFETASDGATVMRDGKRVSETFASRETAVSLLTACNQEQPPMGPLIRWYRSDEEKARYLGRH